MTPDPSDTARGSRSLRAVSLLAASLGFCSALGASLYAIDAALNATGTEVQGLDPVGRRLAHLETQRQAGKFARSPLVVLVGDSMLIRGTGKGPQDRLERKLAKLSLRTPAAPGQRRAARKRSVRLYRFTVPALGYTSYAYLADELAALKPDVVLLEINALTLSAEWRARWARPELARYVAPGRIPEFLQLPLHRVGLTTDRLLWSVLLRQLGLDALEMYVQEQQRRVRTLLQDLEIRTEAVAGSDATVQYQIRRMVTTQALRRGNVPQGAYPRPTRNTVETNLGHVVRAGQEENPLRPFLASTLRHLESQGVAVQVFVVPKNYQHTARLGLYDRAQVAKDLELLRETTLESGSEWLDLYHQLGDAYFADAEGHLTHVGPDSGAERLATALLPHARSGLERAGVEIR